MATNLIGTWGTIATANADSGQRKLIYDGTYWWYFFMKSTSANTLFYAYSSDLSTWTETSTSLAATTTQAGNTLTAYYDAPTGVVLLTFYTGRIRYLRGVISGTTITWAGTGVTTNNSNAKGAPTDFCYAIAKDSSGKVLLWGEDQWEPWWERSTNIISTSFADTGASWSPSAMVYSYPGAIQKGKLLALAGSNLLGLGVDNNAGQLRTHVYNGSTWTSASPLNVISSAFGNWDAVYISDSSIFILNQSNTSTLTFSRTSNGGTSFAAKTAPSWPTSGLATNSQVSLTTDGTDIWAVVIRGDANKSVSYNKYTVGSDSWGGWTDLETSAQTRAYVAATIVGTTLAVTWRQTNGSNYDAYVATLSLGGGAAVLQGAVTCTSAVAGALSTAIQLQGAISSSATITGALTTGGAAAALQGDVSASASVAGSLSTAIPLAASASGLTSVTGALTTGIPLQASVAAVTSAVSGSLSTSIPLAGTVSATSAAVGALSTSIPLLGTVSGVATVAGALTTSIALQGVVACTSAVAGSLSTAVQLQAGVSNTTTVVGTLTTAIPLAGSAFGVATLSGQFAGTGAVLQGAVTSSAVPSGSLTTQIRMAGAVSTSATVVGGLTTSIPLAGTIFAHATSAGVLSTTILLAAEARGSTDISGDLGTSILLAGAVTGFASLSGDLFVPLPMSPFAPHPDLILDLAQDSFLTISSVTLTAYAP